jgi:hypothetical protein
MMCSTYGADPRLLPLSKNQEVKVKQKLARVPGSAEGHYAQWVNGCIAGYGKMEMSSPFDTAGPLTEALLMANLAIKGNTFRKPRQTNGVGNAFTYPGKNIKLLWDNEKMMVSNFEDVNQFVKRKYREGFSVADLSA